MSESYAAGSAERTTLERDRSEVLAVARPLPSDDEVVIDDLAEDEDRLFLTAILDA